MFFVLLLIFLHIQLIAMEALIILCRFFLNACIYFKCPFLFICLFLCLCFIEIRNSESAVCIQF